MSGKRSLPVKRMKDNLVIFAGKINTKWDGIRISKK